MAFSDSYSVPLPTKSASKVQRFVSRSSFLTNEMLDGVPQTVPKQQKTAKDKFDKSLGCTESQKNQFHLLANSYDQQHQSMDSLNYLNNINQSQLPVLESTRTPRYPNFCPFREAHLAQYPYYSSSSASVYPRVQQYLPHHTQLSIPLPVQSMYPIPLFSPAASALSSPLMRSFRTPSSYPDATPPVGLMCPLHIQTASHTDCYPQISPSPAPSEVAQSIVVPPPIPTEPSESFPSPPKNSPKMCSSSESPTRASRPFLLGSKLVQSEFLSSVLTWSVSCLTQQLQNSEAPPLIPSHKIRKPNSVYDCYTDYHSTYFPLLLLETWELIFQAWKSEKCFHNFFCYLKQYKHDKRMCQAHFETVISNADFSSGKYPVEGNLLIKFGLTGNRSTKIYGYVSCHSSRPFNNETDSDHPCCRDLNSRPVDEGAHVVSLTVETSWKYEDINLKTLTRLQILYFLKPAVKKYEALKYVEHSPLCRAILSPESGTCKVISLSQVRPLKQSSTDLNAIEEIVCAILQPSFQIIVVEALPGREKINSLVKIINFVKSFETVWKKTELLFCSSSSEVLDDLGCCLCFPQDTLKKTKAIHCVRLGKITEIHPEMRKLSINSLVDYYVDRLKQQELNICEKEIEETSYRINETLTRIRTLQKISSPFATMLKKKLPTYQMDLSEKQKRKEKVISKHKKLHLQYEIEAQWHILQNSDVILTTLADCHQLEIPDEQGKMAYVPRTCCIIDDATHCTELETLPPLLNGISKLVIQISVPLCFQN